jgi:hypothetical protein
MTRYTASSPAKFAKARIGEAQKGVAAATLFAMRTATTPVQAVAKEANKLLRLQRLTGVNTKKK